MNDNLDPLDRWRARGRRIAIFGRETFCLDAGRHDAPALLVLHGFPSSSFDFHRVLDVFAERYRVVIHDHPGFGFSAKPADYSYSLLEQAEVAVGLWRELGVGAGHLLAHDYGTSVATELLARRERGLLPIELSSVTLVNGSIHLELARLRPAQRLLRSRLLGPTFARLLPARALERSLRRLWGDPRRARPEDLTAIRRGLEHGGGRRRMPAICRYLDERARFRERWVGALERLDLPAHVLWGREDPVAVPAIAEALADEIPRATLTWLDRLGHYPMLEDPAVFADAVLRYLARRADDAG